MIRRWMFIVLFACSAGLTHGQAPRKHNANRLAYLDETSLYHPGLHFPRLTTPQWIGEPGVDAVVIFAIDDMREPEKYEAFLRPILRRLQKVDGRAPVSIMTNKVNPDDPQLQLWLKEGLSIECHTIGHPCPFFKKGFESAYYTYQVCVDLMHAIPNHRPVAFRMPCCDSLNTPSPRFFAEVFSHGSPKAHFLTLDSSVFNVFTSADPELPKSLTLGADGKERFTRYVPADRQFVNTIDNYPYPYTIGNTCWQFPCVTPSDWQAQHLQKSNNPRTVEDWKAALECTVIKKGVFCLVFHPHGWIKNDQVVDFIDDAVRRFGKRVKFLTFKEAHDRLLANFQAGVPLRRQVTEPKDRGDNGVRVLDVNNDGYMDVVLPKETRLWSPESASWIKTGFPMNLGDAALDPKSEAAYRHRQFGVIGPDGQAAFFLATPRGLDQWTFRLRQWQSGDGPAKNVPQGDILLRDIDGNGTCELMCDDRPQARSIHRWNGTQWTKSALKLPDGIRLRDCRFLDLDGNGSLELLYSNESGSGIGVFESFDKEWNWRHKAQRGDAKALPLITRRGQDNGFFLHSGQMWWSNEDTVGLKNFVDHRRPTDLFAK